MDCLACKHKQCKTEAKDCNRQRSQVLAMYRRKQNRVAYARADQLVAQGRAGTLSRVQEIAEYARLMKYRKIAIAYCYSMESLAAELRLFLKDQGFNISSFRCTLNGIRENQINQEQRNSVNCNPLGQARAINNSDADLVIEMGLCLGHDILFHQYLKKPFTVLIVKDRVHHHNPARAFRAYHDD